MSPVTRRAARRFSSRDFWLTVIPTTLIVIGVFALAYHFVKPAPPNHLVLAIGKEEGGTQYYARRYKEILARSGVTLETRTTSGSAENVKLLEDGTSGVDVAFVQSGTPADGDAAKLVSLGALAYVPLWVFYRGDTIDDPGQLSGKRIAIGLAGGATWALAMKLLSVNHAEQPPTVLYPLDRDVAAEQLQAGQIDAMFVVSPAEAPWIQKFTTTPGVRLLSFARADAYARRYPELTKLLLPEGLFDLAANVPAQDVVLLAPTMNLISRPTLHPALAYLLMRAASEVHGHSSLLNHAGEFPAPREAGFPLSDEARRYYTSGVPFLQRYLPYWAANLVDRLWVMILPLIAVVVPLGRLVPPLYRWRMRSRIYRWYGRLKELELEMDERPTEDHLRAMLRRLDDIERAVNRIPMPLSYAEDLYIFREHVELIRRRINRRLQEVTRA